MSFKSSSILLRALVVLTISLITLAENSARADIQDRINQCESSGSTSCIFNILRELATKQQTVGYNSPYNGMPYSGEYGIPGTNYANIKLEVTGTLIKLVTAGENICFFKCEESFCKLASEVNSAKCASMKILSHDQVLMTYITSDEKFLWKRLK